MFLWVKVMSDNKLAEPQGILFLTRNIYFPENINDYFPAFLYAVAHCDLRNQEPSHYFAMLRNSQSSEFRFSIAQIEEKANLEDIFLQKRTVGINGADYEYLKINNSKDYRVTSDDDFPSYFDRMCGILKYSFLNDRRKKREEFYSKRPVVLLASEHRNDKTNLIIRED